MKLKKLCALALAAALAISALPLSASAAKNPKKNADDMTFPPSCKPPMKRER